MKKLILKKVIKDEDRFLIVTDLDGTFLSDGGNLTHHIKNYIAFQKVKELGHIIVIASGRSPQLIFPIYNYLNLNTPIISFHGALTIDPNNINNGFELNDQSVPIKIIREIILSTDVVKRAVVTEIIGYNKWNSITEKEDINLINFNPYEIVFVFKRKTFTEEEALNLFDKKYSDKIKIKFMPGGSGNNYDMVLIVAPNVDKINALKSLSKYYKIPKEKIIYFGDNYNDLNSIDYAGFGIAVISGKDKVKNKANIITEFSNIDGGVGKFLLNIIEK